MPTKRARLHVIIHSAATEASAVGLATAQIPGDRFIIGGVQIYMIIEIAAEFGKRLDYAAAKALFLTSIACVVGPEIANQMLKYIPGVGNAINASVAASVTETIGWAVVKYFEK
jgi:uncharacterized protein (DUF697 family)